MAKRTTSSKRKPKTARAAARAVKNDERLQAIVELSQQLPMDVVEILRDFSGAYNPRVAEWVLVGLAMGPLRMEHVCIALGGQLRPRHVYGWLVNNEGDFAARYHRALAVQAEAMADEVLVIADSTNTFTAQANRLRISTRQWLMERNSSRFGEKKTIVHEGNPDKPLRTVERGMSTEEAAQAWAEMVKDKGHVP